MFRAEGAGSPGGGRGEERRGERPRRWLRAVAWVAGAALLIAYLGTPRAICPVRGPRGPAGTMDLSEFRPQPLPCTLRVLFIHHSCGGQWLAPVGPDVGEHSIYASAVNGGGLRDRLVHEGYEVHEAAYGCSIGDRTDIFDWPVTFRERMDAVLACDRQDVRYTDGRRNQVVVFKSCFSSTYFVGAGTPPGAPGGPDLTVANAQAAYTALLPEFRRHPDVLFVAVTAPPLACPAEPLWKSLAKRVLGRPDVAAAGRHARALNDWLKDPARGWLRDYPGRNVAVFDLYDLLTDSGASDFSRYASGPNGRDSHPNAQGNARATECFVPFLDQAVVRAGLCLGAGSGG